MIVINLWTPYELEITQDHIDRAERLKREKDPIMLALQDKFPDEGYWMVGWGYASSWTNNIKIDWDLRPFERIANFLKDWDFYGRKVHPMTIKCWAISRVDKTPVKPRLVNKSFKGPVSKHGA